MPFPLEEKKKRFSVSSTIGKRNTEHKKDRLRTLKLRIKGREREREREIDEPRVC